MAPKTKRPSSGASSSSQAQPNLTDPEVIATHLGLKKEGLSDEATVFPNLHPPGSSAFVLDAHDRFLHLMDPNLPDVEGDDVAPPQAPPVVAAPPQVDLQALFAQLIANLDARFNTIDARFTSLNEDVNARFNSLDP
ncbi:hypothetical protein V6N13_110390 [Hibiscus sabdariffa]